MYTVLLDGMSIHDPALNDPCRILMDGVVTKKVNCADSFSFTIYPTNNGYDSLSLLTSSVEVYKDGTPIFHGRPITEETGWDNEKRIVCEGDLALFNDTVIRPYEFTGSVADYVRYLVNQHNLQAGLGKQITVRNITVTDPNDYIVRSCSDYVKTLKELMDKTVGLMGGYLITEFDNGTVYLDYLADSTSGTNQTMAIGKNILDFQRSISTEALATALIPLGASDEETGERLTIKSVNAGSDYITDASAVAERGMIFSTCTWDDVSVPENLLRKARALLTDLTRAVPRIQLTAVDLTNAGYDLDAIGFFEYVTVEDSAHRVSGQYLITERRWNLSAPENDTVTFGSEERTLSGQTARNQSAAERITDTVINKAVAIIDYQTELLRGGAGGYFVIGTDVDGHPSEVYFLDTDDRTTARSVLRINKNGIGFSTTGFDGPYTNAWTIDGRLNASFLYTGTLRDSATGGQKFSLNLDTGEINVEQLNVVAQKLSNIGARNLVLATSEGKTATSSNASGYTSNYYFSEYGENQYKGNTTDDMTISFDYVISGAERSGTDDPRIYVQVNGYMVNSSVLTITDDNLTGKIVATTKLTANQASYTNAFRVRMGLQYFADGITMQVSNLKVERGGVATDWSPAPEDADAQIAENKAAIEVNATNIQSKVSSADYNGNTIASLINQTASSVQIEASKIDLSGYVTINALQNFGGRNYAWAVDERYHTISRQNCTYTYDPQNNGEYVVTIGSSSAIPQIITNPAYNVPDELKGQQVIWHADYIGISGTLVATDPYIEVRFFDSNGNNIMTQALNPNRLSVSFTVPAAAKTMWVMLRPKQAGTYVAGDTLTVRGLKLEKGTVATDWTPAPEDDASLIASNKAAIDVNADNIALKVSQTDYNGNTIASLINQTATTTQIQASKINLTGYVTASSLTATGTTTIDGSRITTGYISADRIAANSITASKINLTDLFSQNITATNMNITGGSINITTTSQTNDRISLSYQDWSASLSPLQLKVSNIGTADTEIVTQAGGIYGYSSRSNQTSAFVLQSATRGRLFLYKEDGSNGATLDSNLGLFLYDTNGANRIRLNGQDCYINLNNSAGQSITIDPGSSFAWLNGASKYSALIWPDSNGAGRLVLGDGTSTKWRTELTNNGLVFRNASDVVTARYPATGKFRITGTILAGRSVSIMLYGRTIAFIGVRGSTYNTHANLLYTGYGSNSGATRQAIYDLGSGSDISWVAGINTQGIQITNGNTANTCNYVLETFITDSEPTLI